MNYSNVFYHSSTDYTDGNRNDNENIFFNMSHARLVNFEPRNGWTHTAVTSIVLGLITLGTVIGNIFVVLAICIDRNLQSVSNYLIASLAVADLMVAILVMPLSILNEVGKNWWLGVELCDVWICFDVMCCTASILHLVAIAIDRLLTFININYVQTRTAARVYFMIIIIWFFSVVISIPSRFYHGRDTKNNYIQVSVHGRCVINSNHGYTIFSTVGAFYLPMVFIIIIYIRIYIVAKTHIRKKAIRHFDNKKRKNFNIKYIRPYKNRTSTGYKNQLVANSPLSVNDSYLTSDMSDNLSSHSIGIPSPERNITNKTDTGLHSISSKVKILPNSKDFPVVISQKERLEQKRERKAARTLAIITGCFLLCWLPFFINALLSPFCLVQCKLPVYVESLFLWLGYINSLLNPIIYTTFSPDFRNAFTKLVCRN